MLAFQRATADMTQTRAELFREWQLSNACKVCQATPDQYGFREHGKGCYVNSEDGGGEDSVDVPDELASGMWDE